MRVPLHLVEARREQVAQLVQQHAYLPVSEVCQRLGISEATARRDLAALAREKRVTRTYGGALVDFNQQFPSFHERQFKEPGAKRQMAVAALRQIKSSTTCFFDAGTTVYAIAEALAAKPVKPLKVVTNSLPVAQVLSGVEDIEVNLLGGQYLPRQSVLLGRHACDGLQSWDFDLAFIGAEGMTKAGLWNSHEDVVQLQRAVVKMATRVIFCVDAAKLGYEAPHFLLPWSQADTLLTNTPPQELLDEGIRLSRNKLIRA